MDNQEDFFNTNNNDQARKEISLSAFLTQSSNEEMRIAETGFH